MSVQIPADIRIVAATAVAGLIGAAGIGAAAATTDDGTTSEPPAISTAGQVPDTTVAWADTTSPATAVSSADPAAARTSDGADDIEPSTDPAEAAAPSSTAGGSPDDGIPGGDPADAEPADEIDESEPEGEPGVIGGIELPDSPPPPPAVGEPTLLVEVPKPLPPLPPVPGPVDLVTPPMDPGPPPIDDLVAPTDPTPFDVATGFQVVPLPGYLGELTSGYSGCQLDCVQTAILTANAFNANVHLAVEATVPVHVEVEVTRTGTDSSKFFNNPGYDTVWETTIEPLQPDTSYDLTLIAIDQDGHSKVYEHRFTTVDIIDGFAGNAQGCALECITSGVVDKTGDAGVVEVHVETNAPAALQLWVSTNSPTWVDDPDAKPAHGPVYENENASTSWTFDVGGLEPETLYHVVARAEDDHGVAYRVGTFTTDTDPNVDVLVTFEEIDVTYDGDQHEWNKGELRFAWGFDGTGIGHRGEQKMNAGSISLDAYNSKWFSIDADHGTIPDPTVSASERDADGLIEFCSMGLGPGTEPVYIADCDAKVNVAKMNRPIGIGEIADFPLCVEWGVVGPTADARCTAIGSGTHGTRDDDYAHFTVIISFVVD